MLKVLSRKEIDKRDVKRILIRSTNWVGDAVMTLPSLDAVRANFPESDITVLAKPWVEPVFKDHPSVDRVMTFNKGGGAFTGLGEMIRMVRLIRRTGFDLAILFQNAFEAALLAYLGGVRFRLGYNTDGRGLLLTHQVIRNDEVLRLHQVEYYLSMLGAVGWEAKTAEPSLFVSQKERKRANDLLDSVGIDKKSFLVGLGPGAIFGGAKRWPPDRFSVIGDRAVEEWGAEVLVFGADREAKICNRVCDSMSQRSFNLCGNTSLSEAICMISRCGFFVTNDSGLMHVASALGVPTVAIFGPTDPVATGPRGAKSLIVRHEIECAPCLRPECPDDHRCMSGINAEEVWAAMESLRRDVG